MIKKLTLIVILIFLITAYSAVAQVFQNLQAINPISTRTHTGLKPQSKVWKNQGFWWCVLNDDDGSHVFRLDTNSWTKVHTLTDFKFTYADCKVVGDTTHILLFGGSGGSSTRLASVEYQSSGNTYTSWSVRPGNVGISLASVETATIDIDSQDRMWLAYETDDDIVVSYSERPYSSWLSLSNTLYSGVDNEDICAITAFDGNKIGVLWSNQFLSKFQFSYRSDTDPITTWTSPVDIVSGTKIADNHINLAVDSQNGTIYAAVKTSYDNDTTTTIGLLKRNPAGTWDSMYDVETPLFATRPIVLLNEFTDKLYVVYTITNGGNVYVRESSTSSINFGPRITLKAGDYNNVTSTKASYTDDIVILYSTQDTPYQVEGFYSSDGALPVELASFTGKIINGKVNLIWHTETEVDNYGFEIQRSAEGIPTSEDWEIIGFVDGHGNSNSPKNYSFQDNPFPRTGSLYYRLKQIDTDGQFEYSESIEVKFDALEQFVLYQNYPNPFNPTTKISWYSPYSKHQSIKLFDILGNEVAVLFDEFREAGNYEIEFNAEGLSSGVYFYQLKAGDFIQSKKMIISK